MKRGLTSQKTGDIMYMDPTIPIPEGMPAYIYGDLEDLQKLYDEGDDLTWDVRWEGAESGIKEACIDGKISEGDLRQLFRRYGLGD